METIETLINQLKSSCIAMNLHSLLSTRLQLELIKTEFQ